MVSFVQQNGATALQIEKETGIPHQLLLAIPGNETGWGSAMAGNNYFGIKGSSKSGANTGAVGTWEVINGKVVNIQDTFRAYGGYEESARDFVDFLRSNSRYQGALNYLQQQPNDWRGFIRMVHDAGYATDPEWSNKIINIGNSVDGVDTPYVQANLPAASSGRRGVTSVIDSGSTAIGSKYVWGGAGGRSNFDPNFVGSDCSGFVSWAYQQGTGLKLPAQTQSLWGSTQAISPGEAAPGDLVMYNMGQGAHMEHVGIYLGNGQMLHDSSINPNGGVDITPLWDKPQFRRVPGVDPNLASYSVSDSPARMKPTPVDTIMGWTVTAHAGRMIAKGVLASGALITEDLGPTDQPTGTLIGNSMEMGSVGNMGMGSGQDVLDEGTRNAPEEEEDETDYSFLDTPLSPQGEAAYQIWKAQYAPKDSGWDYDLRGAFTAGLKPDSASGHWPDTYKKPNHPTFSDQSKWAKDYPSKAGRWEGEQYIKPGAGQDTGEESFFNPSTGNWERLQNVPFDIASPIVPNFGLSRPGHIEAPSETPASPQPKPGEAAEGAIGRAAEKFGASAEAGTLGSDFARGAADVIGGAFSGLGSLGRGAADTLGGLAQTAGENAEQAQQPPEPVQRPPSLMESVNQGVERQLETATPIEEAPAQVGEAVGETVQNLGQTTQDVWGAAQQAPATAAAAAVTGAKIAGEVAEQPEVQGAVRLGQDVAKIAASPAMSGAIPVMAPGVLASVNYLTSVGFDPTGMGQAMEKAYTPEPGSRDEALAKGEKTLQPGDVPGMAWDTANKFIETLYQQRVEAVKAAQPPEIRDSVEGQAMQHAIAMATDPSAYIGMGEVGVGKKAVEEAAVAAKAAQTARTVPQPLRRAGQAIGDFLVSESGEMKLGGEATAEAAERARAAERGSAEAARAAPRGSAQSARQAAALAEYAQGVSHLSPESQVAVALDRTYSYSETLELLQSASLDLNSPALEQAAKSMVSTGKYEPLTGEQLRRVVLNAVADANPEMHPYDMLDLVDTTLYDAGYSLLTRDASIVAGLAPVPEDIFAARAPWWTEGARRAATLEREILKGTSAMDDVKRWGSVPAASAGKLHDALAAGAEAAAGAPGGLKRVAAAAGVGALTGGSELAYGDEDDPDHYGKALTKGMVGFGLALGAPYIASGINKSVVAPMLENAKEILAPAAKLSKPARDAYEAWAGQHMLSIDAGGRLEDEWRQVFGKRANIGLAEYIERTGRLPDDLVDLPGAQAALDKWKAIAQWARDYEIVPDPLGLGSSSRVQTYVPHVLRKEWDVALKAAPAGREAGRRSRFYKNPFRTYNQNRTYETIADGLNAGAQYEDDLPRILGNYYTRAIQQANNQAMVDRLIAQAEQNHIPNYFNAEWTNLELKGEDIVRARGRAVPEGWIPLNRVEGFQGFKNLEDVHISPDLYTVFNNAMGSEGSLLDLPGFRQAADLNSIFKHNMLSGSAFHLINEVRQTFATQGASAPMNIGKMVMQVSTPGGYRRFIENHADLAQQALKDGLTLTTISDRMDHLGLRTRWGLAVANGAIGSVSGYQYALNAGMNDQDALKMALAGGAVGLGTSAPVIHWDTMSPERRSMVEHLSHAMWDRWIPFLKLTTYEMYAPQFGGRAAAEFANEVYGGQNLLAIARSRKVQDAMSIAMLAPDWQEGWARLAGNALFNWGGAAPTGDMARNFWGNALVQHAVLLEGMNLAFGGGWSWQNDPDATLMVNASRIYDMMGWDHTDPKNGQPYTPYWDVLGPYRGMIEPLEQVARWGTAGAYKASGYDIDKLPLHDEVSGKWGKIPEADPADAIGRFLSSRSGWLLSTAGEAMAQRDFAERPIDQADDSEAQKVINRIWQITDHMQPTGMGEGLKDVAKSDPWPVAGFSALTGMRTRRDSETTKFFEWQDQFVKENQKDTKVWSDKRAASREQSIDIDKRIEAIQSGLRNRDGSAAKPGESDMTPRERTDQIQALALSRPTQRKDLQSLIDERHLPDGPEKDDLQQHLNELLASRPTSGGQDPVDLDRPDLNMEDVYRSAWNRDPNAIARLQGTAPPLQGLDWLGEQVRGAIHNPPGSTPPKELADLRTRWTTETADTWGIDIPVLQDNLKAKLYDMPGGLPKLPGVTSAQLDELADGYQRQSLLPNGEQIKDAGTIAQARQVYLHDQAQALGLDEQALSARIKLRNLPLADTSEAGLSRSRALDVLSTSRFYPYQNPDGSPMGEPKDWKEWDTELADKTRFNFKSKDGKGFFFDGNGNINEKLTEEYEAKQRATANRYRSVYNSPDKNDYYRWFGDGANLNDAQWKAYTDGTLDMWTDKPSQREALNRVQAMRVWASLVPEERWVYGIPEVGGGRAITWEGEGPTGSMVRNSTSLANYIAYINLYKNKHYTLGDIDPDPQEALSSAGVG